MKLGIPLWHKETGERFTYCGPGRGVVLVKNKSGLRRMKAERFSVKRKYRTKRSMNSYTKAVVKIRWEVDPNEPELEAEILSAVGRAVEKVKITGKHGVWTGAVLTNANFRVVKVVA